MTTYTSTGLIRKTRQPCRRVICRDPKITDSNSSIFYEGEWIGMLTRDAHGKRLHQFSGATPLSDHPGFKTRIEFDRWIKSPDIISMIKAWLHGDYAVSSCATGKGL